jgi:alkaline phosphatase
MKNLVLLFLLVSTAGAMAQSNVYTTANAHAHNDYQHEPPLISAYNSKFGSIEADVYLSEEEVLVAHSDRDIPNHKTLENVYIKPLLAYIKANNGYVYEDTTRSLILMLDVKSDATSTLSKIVDLFSQYPEITGCKSLMILVSGNKPVSGTYVSYPSFIWFDGLLSNRYNKEELSRIAVLSDNFREYSSWKGVGDPPAKDWLALQKAVAKGHDLGKKVRFWNTPDMEEGWQKILELGVDYIDTYSIKGLAEYLKKNTPAKISK